MLRPADVNVRTNIALASLLAAVFAGLALWHIIPVTPGWGTVGPTVTANVALLGLAVYLIWLGAHEERTRPFAGGVLLILAWAGYRYADLFSDSAGMLGAAALFGLCGAGLIVIARFWSRVSAAKRERPSVPPPTPATLPAWLERPRAWITAHRRPLLIASAVAHVLILAGMIVNETIPLAVGKTVLLNVRPVDPRDMMRGDYVVLTYDLNTVPVAGVTANSDEFADRTVYVPLVEADDGTWKADGSASLIKPVSGVYLRGLLSANGRASIRYGIEAFYVPEGKGLEWERLRNAKTLKAEVAVTPWGHAKLRRLVP